MSITTRTSPTEKKVKSCFGDGFGLAHELDLALRQEEIKPFMLKQVVSNPLLLARLGALLRGEAVTPPSKSEEIVAREMVILAQFSALAGSAMPSQNLVEEAYRKALSHFGSITEHDRFVPHGLTLSTLFGAVYAWNEEQQKAGGTGIKLYHEVKGEWWRNEKSVEKIPTVAGVFRADLGKLVAPYDIQGRPFSLTYDEQVAWAKEQGGDGLSSVEEAFYIVIRKLLEHNVAPWGAGAWLRCRNTYGSDNVLTVGCCAGNGLYVDHFYLGKNWSAGVLPRKSGL